MKQRLMAVACAVALSACGSDSPPTGADLCTKAGNVVATVKTKVAACVPDAGSVFPTGSTCTTRLASCTAADQGVLNSVLGCLDSAASGAPLTTAQCSSTTFTNLATALDACTDSSHLGTLSPACKTAMDLDSVGSGTVGAGSCTYAAGPTLGGTCVQLVGMDMSAVLCSMFNQQGLVFTYSSSSCPSQVGGQSKLGTCSLSSIGLTSRMAIYGASGTDAATQCAAQGGTWTAGS